MYWCDTLVSLVVTLVVCVWFWFDLVFVLCVCLRCHLLFVYLLISGCFGLLLLCLYCGCLLVWFGVRVICFADCCVVFNSVGHVITRYCLLVLAMRLVPDFVEGVVV